MRFLGTDRARRLAEASLVGGLVSDGASGLCLTLIFRFFSRVSLCDCSRVTAKVDWKTFIFGQTRMDERARVPMQGLGADRVNPK